MEAHRVPRRFDTATLLAVTAACALLFGILRALNAPPEVFGGLVLSGVIVSLSQVLTKVDPRMASTLCGAMIAPLIVLATSRRFGGAGWLDISLATTFAAPAGGFCGYAIGACCAGVFLIVDVARGVKPRPAFRGWLHRSQPLPPNAVAASYSAARLLLAESPQTNEPPVRRAPPTAGVLEIAMPQHDSAAGDRHASRSNPSQ